MLSILFISMFILIFLGMDLMLVLVLSCVFVIGSANFFQDAMIPIEVVPQYMFGGVDSFAFTAIPLFILAGEIMNRGGITGRLVEFSNKIVGHWHGGLAQSSVALNTVMAGISGSAVADCSATGSVLIPAMKSQGYSAEKSAAIIASASTIGPIIPPSIPFIVLGGLAEISVGKLFLAGVIPGVLMAASMMVYLYFYAKSNGLSRMPKSSFKEKMSATKNAILPLGMPVLILGSIITGLASPTESAVLGVLYALIVCGLIYRTLTFKVLYDIFLQAGLASGMIMLMIAAGRLFGWTATFNNIGDLFGDFILNISTNPTIVMFIIIFMLLLLGCVLEVTPIILLVTPILFPIVLSLGVDPIQFGTIMVVSLMIGLLTPPIGLHLFITSAIADVPIMSVARAAIPFWLLILGVIILITLVPSLTLFIPNLLN
ncbi:TRAP transporter large permease [Neobacillus mesonae]|uniref:TRAP transporter large permease n=1 Tax=Neobacillus mesonae TaxID=1193713 RepID=UPI00203C2B50|nr:TRAP transporter large permease [Neobacillus mesonae]MCM3569360.1 TRAP transporter large permease [Neobacillus mesonae]